MSVTPDKPDFTAYTANVPDARLVGSGVGTANHVGTVLALDPTDRSVIVLAFGSGGSVDVTLTGDTTGLAWSQFAASNPYVTLGVHGIPTAIPVFGVIDNQATIAFDAGVGNTTKWWAVAIPDEVLVGTQLAPLFVSSDLLANNVNTYQAAATSGNETTVLANIGGGGYSWEVEAMGWFQTAAATIAGRCTLRDTETTLEIAGQFVPVGGVGSVIVPGPIHLQNGLTVVNHGIGSSITGWAIARQLLLPVG